MDFGLLNKYRSQLMGIATILICVFHGVSVYHYYPEEPNVLGNIFLSVFGSVGVEIFLILSGIGNYHSLKKDSSVKAFYQRKMSRLLPSVSIICTLFWVYKDIIVENKGVINFILDLSGISFWVRGESRYWYICLIFLCYFISPFLYRLSKRQKYVMLFMMLFFPIISEIAVNDLFVITEIATCRIAAYILGFIIGERTEEKTQIGRKYVLLFFLFCLFLVMLRSFHLKSITRFCKLPVAIGICFATSFIFYFVPIVYYKLRELLAFCGKYSLEIYIVQVSLIWICVNQRLLNLTRFYNYLFLMAITLIISMIVNQISKKIIKTLQ